jgi:hypothetical protein
MGMLIQSINIGFPKITSGSEAEPQSRAGAGEWCLDDLASMQGSKVTPHNKRLHM